MGSQLIAYLPHLCHTHASDSSTPPPRVLIQLGSVVSRVKCAAIPVNAQNPPRHNHA